MRHSRDLHWGLQPGELGWEGEERGDAFRGHVASPVLFSMSPQCPPNLHKLDGYFCENEQVSPARHGGTQPWGSSMSRELRHIPVGLWHVPWGWTHPLGSSMSL